MYITIRSSYKVQITQINTDTVTTKIHSYNNYNSNVPSHASGIQLQSIGKIKTLKN